jgi:hypothetical protein
MNFSTRRGDEITSLDSNDKKYWKGLCGVYWKHKYDIYKSEKEFPRLREFLICSSYRHTSSNREDGGMWWTCAFICPITGRTFTSGTMIHDGLNRHQILCIPKMSDSSEMFIGNLPTDFSQDEIQNELSRLLVNGMENVENIRISDGNAWVKFRDVTKANDAMKTLNGIKIMNQRIYATRDERVYYRTDNDAMEACAARVLDCLNCNNEGANQRLCQETPELFEFQFEQSKGVPNNDWAVNLGMYLHNYYNQLGLTHQVHSRNIYDYEQLRSDNNVVLWTACFTCPMTGIKINSGTVKFKFRSAFSDWKKNDDEVKVLKQNGKVYYESKKIAQRACIAAVIDSLPAQLLCDCFPDKDILLDRYCEEEPAIDLGAKISEFERKKAEAKQVESSSTSWVQNPMTAIAYLHRLYNPKVLRASSISQAITYKSSQLAEDTSKKIYWTAEFESQITSERFKSGIMKNQAPIRIDGDIYYPNKKTARMAAIGRSVDCFIHRGGWITGNDAYKFPDECRDEYIPFCVDDPYDSSPDVKILIDKFVPPPQKEKSLDAAVTPKGVINNRYQKLLREPISQDCYNYESIDVDIDGSNVTYWTCTFECPITGKLFPCGTLINIEESSAQGLAPSMKEVDGLIYYYDKKNAEHAAAGRTFDILSATNFFSSFGVNDFRVIPRFCVEDPHSYIDEYYSDDEDDDEYVIQEVPRTGKFTIENNSHHTTMDVVLDAWANYSDGKESKSSSIKSDVYYTAKSWLEKMKSEAGTSSTTTFSSRESMPTLRQTTVSTFSCNAILKALANTSRESPSDKIEEIAKDIIKLMIELSSPSSNEALPCVPDTSTFTSYMRCLKSPSPEVNLKRAEALLQNMQQGDTFEGFKLPKPDCDTFNAVMRHCKGVNNSYERMKDIFSLLETATATSSSGLKPNKETFMILLSALAESSDQFRPEEAKQWIDRMQYYAAMSDDDNMLVDTEVYNAPLPLPIDYNNFMKQMKKQFIDTIISARNDNDPLRSNSVNIENWFHDMQRTSYEEGKLFASPNIDTYDAVIQAWIQNISQEGLDNAEKWAFEVAEAAAQDSDISPRLDTFRALTLGWALSRSDQAPEKVQYLLEKLDAMSESFPELKPDGNMRSLLLVAWKYQQSLVSNEESFRMAQDATVYLRSIIQSDDSTVVDEEAFVTVLHMWKDAARNCPGEFGKIASEMMKIVKMYDTYTDSTGIWNEENYVEYDENDESKRVPHQNHARFRSVILNGDCVMEEFMKNVTNIPGLTQEDKNDIIVKYFHQMERFLLRRKRFQRLCSPTVKDWGVVEAQNLPFPEPLFRESLNWCKFLTDPTRNADGVQLAMDILHWTINYHQQGAIAQTIAVELYAEVIDVVKSVVPTVTERNLLFKKIVSDIVQQVHDPSEESNSVLSAMKDFLPENLDVSDLPESGKKSSSAKRSKRRKSRKKAVR